MEAEVYLSDYMERIRPALGSLDTDAAHEIAMAVLTYKIGVYDDTVRRCAQALELLEGQDLYRDLGKALTIVRTRAADLQASGTISTPLPGFEPGERARIPLTLEEDAVEDISHLRLVNALVLLYAVGRIASPRDEQALEEQEQFAIQLLETFKGNLE